jgi:hypothetical protein
VWMFEFLARWRPVRPQDVKLVSLIDAFILNKNCLYNVAGVD